MPLYVLPLSVYLSPSAASIYPMYLTLYNNAFSYMLVFQLLVGKILYRLARLPPINWHVTKTEAPKIQATTNIQLNPQP